MEKKKKQTVGKKSSRRCFCNKNNKETPDHMDQFKIEELHMLQRDDSSDSKTILNEEE